MSNLKTITVKIPLITASLDILKSYENRFDASSIAVAYLLLLRRFLDINSYVYQQTITSCENDQKPSSAQKRRCVVDLEPEHTLLEAMEAVKFELFSDNGSTQGMTARHLAYFHQDIGHHGTNHSDYAIGLVLTEESCGKDDAGSGLTAVLDFNEAIFSNFQAQNMARAFFQVLRIVTSGTEKTLSLRLSEVDMVSPEDHDIVHGWNTDRPLATQQCIPDLVERICTEHTDRTAITSSYEGSSLTYGQLNRLADRLGMYLVQEHGLARGTIVPLCFDKSTVAVVTMLAVFKTGAAYCCLDPHHPRERHEFIIQSVKAPIVLVSSQHQGLFSRPTLVVDSTLLQQFDYETKDERFTFSSRRPEDTCIVVFSSGSTGVPKGIVHTHQSLATGLVQNGPRHGLDRPGVRVFQWCAYTFDIALSEIWGPLICGGVVCIPSEEERLNDVETPMKRMSVEWAFFTPSFARFFCRQKYSVETLETLVVGGEALTHQDARAFLAKIGLKRVIHLFGPAELITQFLKTLTPHFYNTESPIENGKPDNVSFVPSNAHCWIVDPDDTGRLAPVGAVGELLIEGPALLNGYLNDAARDAIAFVDTPDWRLKLGVEPPVSRIYRSGDLVRYVGNGEIQYVSRKDGVIKLHGQFIDLGEIESVLRASLGQGNACVEMELFETEAAVLPVHNVPAPGDQTLVTFLCVKNNEQALQDRSLVLSTVAPVLQTLLRKKLPEYMIPRLFYLIEHFPYNASGKLDRKALGSLASTFTMADLFQLPSHSNQVQEGQSEVAGESLPSKEGDYVLDEHGYQELSTLLTRAWVDVFGCSIDEVAHQDFFQQGGNSMRAMELVAAARRNGVSISVTKIFRNPEFNRLVSVASLSVKRDESVGDNATVPRFSLIGSIERRDDILNQVMEQCRGLKMSEVQDVLPATPLQSEFMAESLLYPGSFKAQTWFAIPTEVSFESFRTLWQHLIDKFANLRCRIVHTTKYGDMQVVLNTGRSCSWIEADKFSMEEYWLKDRANPMGYGDPLVRYATIGGAEGSNRVVLLTMHQCIFDGFTVKRIEYALGDLVQGKAAATISMPPFASFIKHITTQLDENDAKQFWENYLAGYAIDKPNEPFPSLPTPSYLPRADSLFAANVHFPAMSLAADRRSHITLPTIFLAAWALVINHYTGANDIVFPMHISGRGLPVPKLMEMAFPTIASVPVRIQLPSDVLSLFQHPEESVPVSPQDLALLEGFLQTLQADQIQLATTGFGHIGYDTIATYSDSCSRAIETCKHFPLGNLNIQYAVATWRPRPQDEKDAASAVEAQDQLRLEFQVNRNDAKYFSPGDALTPGCYILNDETARLVMVYDSKVVPDEKLAEYTSKFEEFVRALTTRLTC